jgi:hypothetical protein
MNGLGTSPAARLSLAAAQERAKLEMVNLEQACEASLAGHPNQQRVMGHVQAIQILLDNVHQALGLSEE